VSKRLWCRVHSFTGVVTGLMLFVICWSGTFAVVSNELDWLVTPEARSANPAPPAIDWGRIHNAVRGAYPKAKVSWMEAPLYTRSTVQTVVNFPDQDSVRVYVDAASGEVTGASSYFTVQRFFRSFHMNLFLPNRVGSYLVMSFAVTLTVSMIAGLFFYKRWWRRFFRFNARSGAILSESHKLAGLWSLWFILIMCITGIWYLFEMMRGHVGDGIIAYAGTADYAQHRIAGSTADPAMPLLSVNELVGIAAERRVDLDVRTISFDRTEDGSGDSVYFDGQSEHWLVRDRANQLHLDRRTGETLYDQRASAYPLYWRWSDTADPLHFGDFAGLTSKLIWFCFGLLLSALILTGTWLHARRLERDPRTLRRHRWPGTTAALVVSIAVLTASLPYGFTEAHEFYGPTVDGAKTLPTLAVGVKVTIIVWVSCTLAVLGLWAYLLRRALVWRPDGGSVSHASAPRKRVAFE